MGNSVNKLIKGFEKDIDTLTIYDESASIIGDTKIVFLWIIKQTVNKSYILNRYTIGDLEHLIIT